MEISGGDMPVAAATKTQRLPAEAKVLTTAVSRAAKFLGINNATLGRTIGLSPSTITRLHAGAYELKPEGKEFELALLFVRLFRSLDSIMGGDDEASRSWLRTENRAFEGPPLNRITSVPGLVDVVAYLDAHRARI
jgi:hypothetical protein